MWAAIEPRGQTLNVDCSSYREVLQTRFWQAPWVATLTQAKARTPCEMVSFNACSFIGLAFPLLVCFAAAVPVFQRLTSFGLKLHMTRR